MTALPEVLMHHQRAPDEQSGDRARAACATCGWHGPWRNRRGGWAHRDWYWHNKAIYELAMDAVWNGQAQPVHHP